MAAETPHRSPGPRARALLVLAAVLSVVVPYLFWNGTWFGRPLNDGEMGRYLRDDQHPRHIQHALTQISSRMARGDASVRVWYPDLTALAHNRLPEIRTTAAWVMGQDNRADDLHRALLALLADPDLAVRRNAALALVRFQDPSGRPVLVDMLRTYTVPAAESGHVSIKLEGGQRVGAKALLARVRPDHGLEVEVRSPVFGQVEAIFVHDGSRIAKGDRLVSVRPEAEEVWETLRALWLVGRSEDLAAVELYARGVPDMPDRIRQQATLTAQAIRRRSEPNPSR